MNIHLANLRQLVGRNWKIPTQTVQDSFTVGSHFNRDGIDYSGHTESESDAQSNLIGHIEYHDMTGKHIISTVNRRQLDG